MCKVSITHDRRKSDSRNPPLRSRSVCSGMDRRARKSLINWHSESPIFRRSARCPRLCASRRPQQGLNRDGRAALARHREAKRPWAVLRGRATGPGRARGNCAWPAGKLALCTQCAKFDDERSTKGRFVIDGAVPDPDQAPPGHPLRRLSVGVTPSLLWSYDRAEEGMRCDAHRQATIELAQATVRRGSGAPIRACPGVRPPGSSSATIQDHDRS